MNGFIEDIDNSQDDPLDSRSQDFDWDTLYDQLGESQAELTERDYNALVKALKRILTWLADVDLNSEIAHKVISRRVLAFLWVINPDYFEGQSLTKLAALTGQHKAALSPHAAEASRTFGIRNRGQSHAWNFNRKQDA